MRKVASKEDECMVCLKCGRQLKRESSQAAGYGPVCYRNVFGGSIKTRKKEKSERSGDVFCCDIPGQITLEEYLQTYNAH